MVDRAARPWVMRTGGGRAVAYGTRTAPWCRGAVAAGRPYGPARPRAAGAAGLPHPSTGPREGSLRVGPAGPACMARAVLYGADMARGVRGAGLRSACTGRWRAAAVARRPVWMGVVGAPALLDG